MGGVIIIMSVTISCFLLIDLNNPYVWIVFLVFIGLGILGFIDDYAKISNNRNIGLSASSKFWLQGLISVSVCVAVSSLSPSEYVNKLALPFFKNVLVDLGYFYIPFATIVVVGSSNAVNLTDGLDGLAIVPIGMVAACFMVISYVAGSAFYANYLQIIYVPDIAELSVFCASLIGASLGFLWFNSQPAEIFMGDTGSLSLGGVLGIISVISKHEIVLSIVGGLFVIETLSVIIQVYYFKVSKGRRIFYMAPLHHHFEKKGWSESRVVVRFWIISAIFALMGLSSLKLR
jgi:phospho-N-acetylmuramoyl-pentapeptide-transferase